MKTNACQKVRETTKQGNLKKQVNLILKKMNEEAKRELGVDPNLSNINGIF